MDLAANFVSIEQQKADLEEYDLLMLKQKMREEKDESQLGIQVNDESESESESTTTLSKLEKQRDSFA